MKFNNQIDKLAYLRHFKKTRFKKYNKIKFKYSFNHNFLLIKLTIMKINNQIINLVHMSHFSKTLFNNKKYSKIKLKICFNH